MNDNLFKKDKHIFDFSKSSMIISRIIIRPNKKSHSIECDTPEIGTKIEYDIYKILEVKKDKVYNIYEDYYNNKIREIYFYPFFNMDKDYKDKGAKYNLTFYDNNRYDFFIYKYYKENQKQIKFKINNKNIVQILYNSHQNKKIELYIFLNSPPKVYMKKNVISTLSELSQDFFIDKFNQNLSNLYKNIDPNNPNNYYKVKHENQKDIILDQNKKELEINNFLSYLGYKGEKDIYQREVSYFSLDNEYLNLYLNDLIIKISFGNNRLNKGLLNDFLKKLKSMRVRVKNIDRFYIKIKSLDISEQDTYKLKLEYSANLFYESLKKMIPNLQYSIMSLLTLQQISIFNFDIKILEYLSNLSLCEQEKAVKILEEINKTKNYTNIYLDIETFKKDYSNLENNHFEYSKNSKSIIITPSKIIYNIPVNSITNHFQRKLINYNDNIIKVSILDDDKDSFIYKDINTSPKLSLFIRRIFKDGITLGFCKYDYIGSSISQLKNLGGWMINLEGIRKSNNKNESNIKSINNDIQIVSSSYQFYNNCEEVIDEFGNFSKEQNIFKNTSRKGMIFSDTKYVTDIDTKNISILEDEKIGEYIITDGIGKISKNLIDLAAKKWGISDFNLNPISSIQMRFMGAKGVLTIDPSINNDSIHLRKSQIKFDSTDTSLNVCSVSNYKEAELNRQYIILLSSLGVKDEIFKEIENDIIKKYDDFLKNPNNILLNVDSPSYEFKNKLNQFFPIFDDLYNKKINLLNEPLFSQFIHLFVYSKLIALKYSGKLNDKKTVCLMGVIDETNTLEEDQVYIHLINSTESCKINKILNQKITVYRSPSLYPGDIKILNAVDNPKLSHLVNVIVFSKKGKRPTFNKLSGGDLDGDRYFISFNDNITNNIIDNKCEPLDDPKFSNENDNNTNIKKDRITIEDSINCMIRITKNNIVGIICDNHLAFADNNIKLKAKDPKCIELCKLFNQEIDASKTGNFIEFSLLKSKNLLLNNKPDFLVNGNINRKVIYESPGILGKLYRAINKDYYFEQFRINFFKKAIRRDYEINLNYITKNCFQYLKDAYSIYNNYKINLCNLMKRYNFCTESELFFNIKIFKNNRGNRGKADSYILELRKLIDDTYTEIIQTYKYISIDIASAIYIASYVNIRNVYEEKVNFSEDYEENIAKILSLFEKEKNDFEELFEEYKDYSNLKEKNRRENKNRYKRIFSMPWVIKDIRDLLIKI